MLSQLFASLSKRIRPKSLKPSTSFSPKQKAEGKKNGKVAEKKRSVSRDPGGWISLFYSRVLFRCARGCGENKLFLYRWTQQTVETEVEKERDGTRRSRGSRGRRSSLRTTVGKTIEISMPLIPRDSTVCGRKTLRFLEHAKFPRNWSVTVTIKKPIDRRCSIGRVAPPIKNLFI